MICRPSKRKALDAVAQFAEERARLDEQRARIDERYRNSILAAADAGLTATQIASRTPHSYQAIQQILHRHGCRGSQLLVWTLGTN